MPGRRQQIPVDMMIKRFNAKRTKSQFVDQIPDRVGKQFLVFPDKLGQGGFRFRLRHGTKIIRKIEVDTVNLCRLLVSYSR